MNLTSNTRVSNTSLDFTSLGNVTANTSCLPEQLTDQRLKLTPLFVALYCVAGIIFIPGVLGNGIIIYVVVKIKKMRTPTNHLISSLAIADLMMMVTMVSFLCYVLQPTLDIPQKVNSFLFPSLDILVGSASIGNLAAVSVDRALAVLHPLRYLAIVTSKRVRAAVRCIWVYSFIMFVFAMLRIEVTAKKYLDGFIYAAYTCSFILPLLIIVCCYVIIIFAAISSLQVTNSLEKASSVSLCNEGEFRKEVSKRRRRARIREFKVAMNFMVILLPFLGGWGFFFGLQLYELFTDTLLQNDLQEWFLYVIPWLNSSLNPVVYICLNRPLRKECAKILCKRFDSLRSNHYKITLRARPLCTQKMDSASMFQSSCYAEDKGNEMANPKGRINDLYSNVQAETALTHFDNKSDINDQRYQSDVICSDIAVHV